MNSKEKVLIFAHRGASNLAPENTLKAFKNLKNLSGISLNFNPSRNPKHVLKMIDELEQRGVHVWKSGQ